MNGTSRAYKKLMWNFIYVFQLFGLKELSYVLGLKVIATT